jgi:hypothetical protein
MSNNVSWRMFTNELRPLLPHSDSKANPVSNNEVSLYSDFWSEAPLLFKVDAALQGHRNANVRSYDVGSKTCPSPSDPDANVDPVLDCDLSLDSDSGFDSDSETCPSDAESDVNVEFDADLEAPPPSKAEVGSYGPIYSNGSSYYVSFEEIVLQLSAAFQAVQKAAADAQFWKDRTEQYQELQLCLNQAWAKFPAESSGASPVGELAESKAQIARIQEALKQLGCTSPRTSATQREPFWYVRAEDGGNPQGEKQSWWVTEKTSKDELKFLEERVKLELDKCRREYELVKETANRQQQIIQSYNSALVQLDAGKNSQRFEQIRVWAR